MLLAVRRDRLFFQPARQFVQPALDVDAVSFRLRHGAIYHLKRIVAFLVHTAHDVGRFADHRRRSGRIDPDARLVTQFAEPDFTRADGREVIQQEEP